MNRCMISELGNILPAFESKLGNWLICVAIRKLSRYAVVVYSNLKSVDSNNSFSALTFDAD